jgi:hypothetical protein
MALDDHPRHLGHLDSVTAEFFLFRCRPGARKNEKLMEWLWGRALSTGVKTDQVTFYLWLLRRED